MSLDDGDASVRAGRKCRPPKARRVSAFWGAVRLRRLQNLASIQRLRNMTLSHLLSIGAVPDQLRSAVNAPPPAWRVRGAGCAVIG